MAFSGRFLIQTATTILVPYSMAMSATTITNSTIYDTPPGDLVNNATAIFTSTGASEAQVQALVQNPQYSLSVLTALAQGVQRLKDVPGRDAVVTFAAAARTQDETRFLAAAMNMLARHHESVAPIAEVSAPGPIVGRTTTGALLMPLPVDYIAWTQNVARHARAAGPELARPSPIHFRSGIAPRPEGVHARDTGSSTRPSPSRRSARAAGARPAIYWSRRSKPGAGRRPRHRITPRPPRACRHCF